MESQSVSSLYILLMLDEGENRTNWWCFGYFLFEEKGLAGSIILRAACHIGGGLTSVIISDQDSYQVSFDCNQTWVSIFVEVNKGLLYERVFFYYKSALVRNMVRWKKKNPRNVNTSTFLGFIPILSKEHLLLTRVELNNVNNPSFNRF